MSTETIDRLFLELSQISAAKTSRELALENALAATINRMIQIRDGGLHGHDLTDDIEKAQAVLRGDPTIPGSRNDFIALAQYRDRQRAEKLKAGLKRLVGVAGLDEMKVMLEMMCATPGSKEDKEAACEALALLIKDEEEFGDGTKADEH